MWITISKNGVSGFGTVYSQKDVDKNLEKEMQ